MLISQRTERVPDLDLRLVTVRKLGCAPSYYTIGRLEDGEGSYVHVLSELDESLDGVPRYSRLSVHQSRAEAYQEIERHYEAAIGEDL